MRYKHPAAAAAAIRKSDSCRRGATRRRLLLAALPMLVVAGPGAKLTAAPLRVAKSLVPLGGAAAAPGATSASLETLGTLGTLGPREAPALPQIDGLSPRALSMALDAVSGARAGGAAGRSDLLTVIDYSLPSTTPRLWVLDVARGRVLFHELVAHGAGSGDNYATHFSNTMDSRQTSLGLFLTGGTYEGGNGYSLRLQGLDPGINDHAAERNIVIHGAWYVSAEHAQQYGRLGRSWGCPALPQADAHSVIDAIKDGTFVYSYSPDRSLLKTSRVSQASSGRRAAPAVLTAATRRATLATTPATRSTSSTPSTPSTPSKTAGAP
jgi:hypothetical protein